MRGALLLILGAVLLVLAEGLKQIVGREYDSWAPALSRVLVRLAGWLHPPRSREWTADIAYLQQEEGSSGVWAAAAHLAAAPQLTGTFLIRRFFALAGWGGTGPPSLVHARAAGEEWAGRETVTWLRDRFYENSQGPDPAENLRNQARNIFLLGQLLVPDPSVVSLVRSADGVMCGFTADSDGREGVCVSASYYARHRRRIWAQRGRRVVVADDEVLEALEHIAFNTAVLHGLIPERRSGFVLSLEFESTTPGAWPCWRRRNTRVGSKALAWRTLARRSARRAVVTYGAPSLPGYRFVWSWTRPSA
ncbi:MAG: hypothetical protein ACTHKT_14195 [Solirubrobacterales bacterium]